MGQQTEVTQAPIVGAPGQIASSRQDNVKLARAAEGTVQFGTLVIRGTDPVTQAATPAGAVTAPLGICVNTFDTDEDQYNDGAMINVLRKGHIYVTSVTAFTAGDDVFAENTGGGIRNDATGATQLNGKYMSSGSAGEIAEIEVDLVGAG